MDTEVLTSGAARVKRHNIRPSADSAMKGVEAGRCSARPVIPPLPIEPRFVTAPLVRSTFASTSLPCPASFTTAGRAGHVGAMSKPSTESTAALNAWHWPCVPAFGGFWMQTASVPASSVYCVVTATFGALLV